jgi:putative photosynthetic complex assembly protein
MDAVLRSQQSVNPRKTAPNRLGRGRFAIYAIGLLLLSVLAATAFAVWTGIGVMRMPPAPTLAYRDLAFLDRPDGTVEVRDAATGGALDVLKVGDGSFIRVTVRGLANERRQRGVGADPAFRLSRHADGSLRLTDLGTSRVIVISSFGPTQVETLAKYLPAQGGKGP